MPSTPVAILDSTMTDIADAIRSKTGGSALMTPGQMPAQIASIPTGTLGIPREVSANGVYGVPTQSLTFSLPSNAADIANNALYYAFYGCTAPTSVDFSSLTTVSGYGALNNAFSGCTRLTSLSFPALTASSFGGNTSQFNNMLRNVTGCTVHFPAAIQSTIGSWASVTSGFGGTNTTVLFDL